MEDIYAEISQIIAQGSVSGYVFNDANDNGKYDTGEAKLPNWTVQITQQGTTNTQTATTDSTGSFMIPNLCNGTYTLTEELQPGWSETVPVNPDSYTINITTGNAITNEIFGNTLAPPTPTPKPTATPTPTPVPDCDTSPDSNTVSNGNALSYHDTNTVSDSGSDPRKYLQWV